MVTPEPTEFEPRQGSFTMEPIRVPDGPSEAMVIDWSEPTTVGYEGLDSILPYDGARGTVHRSAFAKTGMLVGRTEQDGNAPRPIGFESSLERATAISALLHPNTFGLKCQPRKIVFDRPVEKVLSNTLDFLVCLRTGEKIYIFVKNEERLGLAKTALICAAIRRSIPTDYGFAQISEASLAPQVRGNNETMFLAMRSPCSEADARLLEVLDEVRNEDKVTIQELVLRCKMGPRLKDDGRAFDAILRAIAGHRLIANRRLRIDYSTVVGVSP